MARWTNRLAALWSRAAPVPPEEKARRTGAILALETLGRTVWMPRDYQSFAREGFMQNPIVYRSVRMVAEAAASIPLLLYEGDAEQEGHPLLDLVARPNPAQTSADFFENWYGYLLVAGNAYAEAVTLGGEVRELHALRPDRMAVVPGREGWPEAFDYTAGGRSVRFELNAAVGVAPILHIKLFHPANDHYGLSPIEAAATAIDIHNTAGNWNKALLDNSARPSGALVYGTGGGRLTAEQFDRLKTEMEANFQGARHAGRPLLLEGGLDWKPLSLSPKDMDFIEAKNAAARDIALAIGVPPMLLGIPGDNTYSDDPYDPGGPTNFGITLKVYAAYTGRTLEATSRARLKDELRAIRPETVRAIYRARYWGPAECASLAPGLALFHFDAAVNHGVGTAIRSLQEAVPHFWRFGRGWLNRVAATRTAALARAAHSVPASANPQPPTQGDRPMTTATEAPATAKWWGHSLTVWGAVVTAAAAILPALGPIIGLEITSDVVRQVGADVGAIVQAITGVIGTFMTLYGRARATTHLVRRDLSLRV